MSLHDEGRHRNAEFLLSEARRVRARRGAARSNEWCRLTGAIPRAIGELSVLEVLEAPPANGPGGTWQADGVEATLARLRRFRAAEAAERGLPPDEVDERLWEGAADEGWRVHPTSGDGHYRYTAPDGKRVGSKAEALALGQEAKRSGRGHKSPPLRAA